MYSVHTYTVTYYVGNINIIGIDITIILQRIYKNMKNIHIIYSVGHGYKSTTP